MDKATFKPTNKPTKHKYESYSGSGSDSDDSSSDDASMFAAQNVEEKESEIAEAKGGKYVLVVHFAKSSWMNLWGIFALILVLNALCCFYLRKKNEIDC